MSPLDLVKLTGLMKATPGRPEIRVGLIDGPVAVDHPDLAAENIRPIPGGSPGACARTASAACLHGTFVAGILSARRDSPAPAICPRCTLLVRPIFAETTPTNGHMPSATPAELAAAVIDAVQAGARVINLSAAAHTTAAKAEPSSTRRPGGAGRGRSGERFILSILTESFTGVDSPGKRPLPPSPQQRRGRSLKSVTQMPSWLKAQRSTQSAFLEGQTRICEDRRAENLCLGSGAKMRRLESPFSSESGLAPASLPRRMAGCRGFVTP